MEMILAQVETLSRYDQVPIVIGMIICLAVIIFSIKYLTPKKIQISGIEAMDITTEMLDKVKGVTIDGSTIEKRAAKLQHDNREALSAQNNMSSIWGEILDEQKAIKEVMVDAYKEAAEREKEYHSERISLQIELNKKLLELANKRK